MSFPMPTTTTAAPAAGGFPFGQTTSVANANPPTFNFGSTNTAAPATTQPVAPLSNFGGFGAPAVTVPPTLPTLTNFATATPSATPIAPIGGGLGGYGASPVAKPAAAATTLPALTGFNIPAATSVAPTLSRSGFGLTSTATPTAAIAAKPALPVLTGFGTTPATTSTAASGFSLAKTTTAPAIGLGLGGAPTAAVQAPISTTGGGFANLTTATKTTDSAAVVNTSQMTYNQLEEYINKWTLELEEQEKVFTEQATQINAWDKVLINNNQKILELNDAVQKVKTDQQMLEQELEFIATQHKELEESISPLQKEFQKLPQVDVERSQTYLMVENLDTQLKQMSEDLKEIIDNLNEANKGQDNSDPIIQIGKILNAHMSSLQWIEASSANITNKLEDVNKMHENFKRDSERSFRSAYYN